MITLTIAGLVLLVVNRMAIYREIRSVEKNMEFRNDLIYRHFVEEGENSDE